MDEKNYIQVSLNGNNVKKNPYASFISKLPVTLEVLKSDCTHVRFHLILFTVVIENIVSILSKSLKVVTISLRS